MNLLGGTVSAVAAPAIYGAWGAGAVFGAAGALVGLAGVVAASIRRRAW
jgi:hypothetical protein